MDNDIKTIKQYGLRRSGTNYIKIIFEKNYKVKIDTHRNGWKHGLCKMKEPMDALVCIKEPYSWLTSIYKHAIRQGEIKEITTFSEFIKQEYIVKREVHTGFDADGYQQFIRENPIVHYNEMHNHWLKLKLTDGCKLVYCLYEAMINEPVFYSSELSRKLGIPRERPLTFKFHTPEKIMLMGGEDAYVYSDKDFQSLYYSRKDYLDFYSDEDINFVSKFIDKKLIKYLGYEILKV